MSDGVRMIPVETTSGSFDVWTRKAGGNDAVSLAVSPVAGDSSAGFLLSSFGFSSVVVRLSTYDTE